MSVLGPYLSIPMGFAVFSVIIVVIAMALSDVAWRVMERLPEDEQDWSSEKDHFVIGE
jgi:hypothetical protein